jgi:hypothetical protein
MHIGYVPRVFPLCSLDAEHHDSIAPHGRLDDRPKPLAGLRYLSSRAATPSGLCRPPGFGMKTLLDGCAR